MLGRREWQMLMGGGGGGLVGPEGTLIVLDEGTMSSVRTFSGGWQSFFLFFVRRHHFLCTQHSNSIDKGTQQQQQQNQMSRGYMSFLFPSAVFHYCHLPTAKHPIENNLSILAPFPPARNTIHRSSNPIPCHISTNYSKPFPKNEHLAFFLKKKIYLRNLRS